MTRHVLAKVCSAALDGVEAYPVRVEVDVGTGLPSFSVVGLPHGSVREGRDRVMAALRSVGRPAPPRRIVVNLAPADRRKEGSALDLPIAIGVLVGAGLLDSSAVGGTSFVGELGLDGSVQAMRGALSVAESARTSGSHRLVLPWTNAAEAAAIPGIEVCGVESLKELLGILDGRVQVRRPEADRLEPAPPGTDLADVKGQAHAKRALEVAAAGGHALFMMGPPGVGKTMLARRLPALLPDLEDDEAIEVTKVHSVAGLLAGRTQLVRRPPFRAPHHTTSDVGLIGGGTPARPGELSLAHGGVLFLDELAEFRRNVLEALRQPLEEGVVRITRARYAVAYPARVQLIAAANPCPCGFRGDPSDRCMCDESQVARYRARTSGPLLDRFDMRIELGQPPTDALFAVGDEPSSLEVRERVQEARLRQAARSQFCGRLNAQLSGSEATLAVATNASVLGRIREAKRQLGLSARGVHRLLKVARTVADLAGAEIVGTPHLLEALSFRAPNGPPRS